MSFHGYLVRSKRHRGCIDSQVSQGLSHTRLHSSTDNGIFAVNHYYLNQYLLPFHVKPHVFSAQSAEDLGLPTESCEQEYNGGGWRERSEK